MAAAEYALGRAHAIQLPPHRGQVDDRVPLAGGRAVRQVRQHKIDRSVGELFQLGDAVALGERNRNATTLAGSGVTGRTGGTAGRNLHEEGL